MSHENKFTIPLKLFGSFILIYCNSVRGDECVYPNAHSFFYSEIQNFTVVIKRPFVFYREIRNFTVALIRSSSFDSEMQNFETVPQWLFCFFTTKHKFLKTAPKRPFVFYNKIQNFESCIQTAICIFHKEIQNMTICHQFSFVS